MKIILFVATSLNSMIARKNGDEDFLSDINWQTFSELAKKHGCFIVGRKTYEAVQKWPDYNFNNIDAKLKIVVSKENDLILEPPFVLASSPNDAVKKAVDMNLGSAILTGGSTVNKSFLEENLIDEIIINIEPIIIGNGISIFADGDFERKLIFVDSSKISEDILQVKYKVSKL